MPRQSKLITTTPRRIHRVAHQPDPSARELATDVVGQVVGQMNEPKSTHRVINDMIEEFVTVMERLVGE